MSPQSVAAVAASVSALAAIVTALIAAYSLLGSRQDSRDRTRPVIVARLRRESLADGSIVLQVKNFGATSARDVHVSFDPPTADPAALPEEDKWRWIGLRYAKPIPNWPPGMSLGNTVRFGHEAVDPFTVKVAYKALDGRRYHDHFYLDPQVHQKETHSQLSTDGQFEKKVTRALDVIARSMDRELG
jgi:hypothetical protein